MGSGADRKGPSRVLTVSSTTHDYQEAAHLPWPDIEAEVGDHFSEEARQAIFDARQTYFESLDAFRQAPPKKDVDELREDILSLCGKLHQIAVVTHQMNKPESKDAVTERSFDGLACQYGGDLREKFYRVAEGCLEIVALLAAGPDGFGPVTRHSPPEVMAFDDLYEQLARAELALGFPPTENTPRFIRLVSWIVTSAGEIADAESVKGARRRRRNAIGVKGGN